MRRILSAAAATAVLATAAIGLAPASSAAPDLSGAWKSAALKMDGVGYRMAVTSADGDPGNAYFVVLRFRYEDGTKGPRIKAGMTADGDSVSLLLNGKGGLADPNNPNIMKGTIGQDGSMFFPTCYKQLKFITKKNADAGCLFQEVPS